MVEKGANINISDNQKNTPLHYAIIGNKEETVRFLVTKKVCTIRYHKFILIYLSLLLNK